MVTLAKSSPIISEYPDFDFDFDDIVAVDASFTDHNALCLSELSLVKGDKVRNTISHGWQLLGDLSRNLWAFTYILFGSKISLFFRCQ